MSQLPGWKLNLLVCVSFIQFPRASYVEARPSCITAEKHLAAVVKRSTISLVLVAQPNQQSDTTRTSRKAAGFPLVAAQLEH